MIAALAALGLLAGAALPMLIARIPDREPEDGKRPRTPYRELAAGRRVPVYLALTTAIAWAMVAATDLPVAVVVTYLVVAALGVAMAYVDLREHRLPDWLTLSAAVVAAVGLGIAAATTGEWDAYGRALLGALAVGGFYLVLAVARPADLGLGDVKLAVTLGLVLGWVGWGVLVVGVFLGFLLGGLVAVALIVARRAGRRSALPFGPFMLAGALIAIVWGEPLVDAYLGR